MFPVRGFLLETANEDGCHRFLVGRVTGSWWEEAQYSCKGCGKNFPPIPAHIIMSIGLIKVGYINK
jgi:hypothetical protein